MPIPAPTRREFLRSAALASLPFSRLGAARRKLPNIVVILADDLGYGDVGVYNPESKIPTPNLDRMAAEGVRFTDAHTPCGVCSPTRYGLLTGRYPWRTELKSQVLWPWDKPLIEKDRLTLPRMLKRAGLPRRRASASGTSAGTGPTTDGSKVNARLQSATRSARSAIEFAKKVVFDEPVGKVPRRAASTTTLASTCRTSRPMRSSRTTACWRSPPRKSRRRCSAGRERWRRAGGWSPCSRKSRKRAVRDIEESARRGTRHISSTSR